jgi:hypothetical protein
MRRRKTVTFGRSAQARRCCKSSLQGVHRTADCRQTRIGGVQARNRFRLSAAPCSHDCASAWCGSALAHLTSGQEASEKISIRDLDPQVRQETDLDFESAF